MPSEHPTWSLPVNDNGAAILMMPCPGTQDLDLGSTLNQLKQQGVSAILSIMGDEEMNRLNVEELPEMSRQNDIQWFNLETDDHKVPGDEALTSWNAFRNNLVDVIDQGSKVAVHCKGGTGRTGVGTAMLLLELGWDPDQAIEDIRSLKPRAFGSEMTVDFIRNQAESLKQGTGSA